MNKEGILSKILKIVYQNRKEMRVAKLKNMVRLNDKDFYNHLNKLRDSGFIKTDFSEKSYLLYVTLTKKGIALFE